MRAAPDRRAALRITVRPNGELTQDDAGDHLVKSFADLIASVSTFMILKPGDIVATATPVKIKGRAARQSLRPGDTFAIECSDIGVLRNRVAREQ
jgi:5-carboxymethyl-2-hydroxymuconate isomerase